MSLLQNSRTKTCSKCKIEKNLTEFYEYPSYKDGFHSWCKDCCRENSRNYAREYCPSQEVKKRHDVFLKTYHQTPEYKVKRKIYYQTPEGKNSSRNALLKCSYGITQLEYDQLFEKQNGLCAIWGKPETCSHKGILDHLSVDHVHTTGKIRGLLCHNCNIALGNFKEDFSILENAIVYLKSRP